MSPLLIANVPVGQSLLPAGHISTAGPGSLLSAMIGTLAQAPVVGRYPVISLKLISPPAITFYIANVAFVRVPAWVPVESKDLLLLLFLILPCAMAADSQQWNFPEVNSIYSYSPSGFVPEV